MTLPWLLYWYQSVTINNKLILSLRILVIQTGVQDSRRRIMSYVYYYYYYLVYLYSAFLIL